MKKYLKYLSAPLEHLHGGLIHAAFWRAAPLRQNQAAWFELLEDALQEEHLIALELSGQLDNDKAQDKRSVSNYAQARSYEFWKQFGFRKTKTGKRVVWTYPAQYDPAAPVTAKRKK